jgi:aspartyl aminopeptidase
MHLVGAHTDSPCLKVKAQPEKTTHTYLSLGVEPYGGLILSSWFDRDLSLAGKVAYLDKNNQLFSVLLDFDRAIGVVPNLAIHLNPKVNESGAINKQTDLPVIVEQVKDSKSSFRTLLKKQLQKQYPKLSVKEVLDFDLMFYDYQKPNTVGMHQEFICGQRVDNLLSCFAGMKALLDHEGSKANLLVCNDHEEVGSSSTTGAAGNFLNTVLERICGSREAYSRRISQSLLVSVDNAHGVHPNYHTKHDEKHRPILNQGPVIKVNANQRYATNSDTSSFFKVICKKAGVPVQSYVNRSDMGCGSTIGPITSTTLGVDTLDIGAPMFAMHSIRETCGTDDIWYLYKALKMLYETNRD